MGQLLVRNLEDELIARLKARAAGNGRSVEAEHREILRAALADDLARRREREALLREYAALRAEAPAGGTDSAALIREDRDRA